MRISKMHTLKCMQLDQYTQKWPQELHKTDGISQGRGEGALIPVTTNTTL